MIKQKLFSLLFISTILIFSCGCLEEKESRNDDEQIDEDNDSDSTLLLLDNISLNLSKFEKGYEEKKIDNTLINFENILYKHSLTQHFAFSDPINDTGYPWIGVSYLLTNSTIEAQQGVNLSFNETMKLKTLTDSSFLITNLTVGDKNKSGIIHGIEGTYYKCLNCSLALLIFSKDNILVYFFIEGIFTENHDFIGMIKELSMIIINNIESENNIKKLVFV